MDFSSIGKTRGMAVLAVAAFLLVAVSAILVMPSASADTETSEEVRELDLYGYKITMMLENPSQVDTVEWDFGDGSPVETVKITTENPAGKVTHTYSAKGDYNITATMKNQYTDKETGELKDGVTVMKYVYHILGYPVVTFDSLGGSDVATIEGKSAHYVAEKPENPTRTGFMFTGWYTDRECTQSFDWSSEITKHTTLYAGWSMEWSGDIYTVTFKFNDGLGSEVYIPVPSGSTVPKPDDPEWKGHTFKGWYLDDKEFDFNTAITSDITLSAHWDGGSDGKNGLKNILPMILIVLGIVFAVLAVLTGYYIFGLPAVICFAVGVLALVGVIRF